ncbi:MAG: hypothetical protein EXS16_06285 [Gemmataceae bacterium]|nr:hypothetical protein [Gemmataceae bacterium]
MNDIAIESTTDAKFAELERRVLTLETKVALMPSVEQIETRITEQVKAMPPPPVEPPTLPSFKDISVPIPSLQALVNTAKTTWTLIEMFNELKMLFWTLFDRRYHMAWATRVIVIVLLVAILLSSWWPFAFDNTIGRLLEKIVNLLLGFVMFFILHIEMRRYQEWLGKRTQ